MTCVSTLRMKQNSELRLLESVPIWMVLKQKSKVWTKVPDVGHEGFKEEKNAAVTWCKVRFHWCVCGRGRAEHSQLSASFCLCGWWTSSWNGTRTWGSPAAGSFAPPAPQSTAVCSCLLTEWWCMQEGSHNPDTFSFPGKRLSNFFCREKVKVSQPMLEACLPCQKYTTHWKSSSGCLSSSSSSAPSPPSFFSLSSSSYSTGTQYLWPERLDTTFSAPRFHD